MEQDWLICLLYGNHVFLIAAKESFVNDLVDDTMFRDLRHIFHQTFSPRKP